MDNQEGTQQGWTGDQEPQQDSARGYIDATVYATVSQEFTKFAEALENRVRLPLQKQNTQLKQDIAELSKAVLELQSQIYPRVGASKLQRLNRTVHEEVVSLKRWRESVLAKGGKAITNTVLWLLIMVGSGCTFILAFMLFMETRK